MAIAYENAEVLTKGAHEQNALRVIDPCGGMKDLETGLLQFPSEQVVREDPVRLLRIYRFAAQLDFEITESAIKLVVKHRSLLSNVAMERCRDELIKIFKVKKAHPHLRRMETVRLLTQVVPSITETNKLWHSLETFEERPIPTALNAYFCEINDYLGEEMGEGADRGLFIKFGLLLGNNVSNAGKHLRLRRKTVQFMEHLISGSTKLKRTIPQFTQKQITRFLRTYASDWWGVLLYAAALYSIDAAVLKRITDTYYEHILPIRKQGKLITGNDLIQTFHLKEGKQIGNLLKEIEKRQFDGEIRTREEAFTVIATLIQQRR